MSKLVLILVLFFIAFIAVAYLMDAFMYMIAGFAAAIVVIYAINHLKKK